MLGFVTYGCYGLRFLAAPVVVTRLMMPAMIVATLALAASAMIVARFAFATGDGVTFALVVASLVAPAMIVARFAFAAVRHDRRPVRVRRG